MTREEAIAAVEESRRTHVEWRDHLAAGCKWCSHNVQVLNLVGDLEHHERKIEKYDGILEVLRARA